MIIISLDVESVWDIILLHIFQISKRIKTFQSDNSPQESWAVKKSTLITSYIYQKVSPYKNCGYIQWKAMFNIDIFNQKVIFEESLRNGVLFVLTWVAYLHVQQASMAGALTWMAWVVCQREQYAIITVSVITKILS